MQLTNLVWASDVQPLPKRMVLLALADCADDDGMCWPSVELLVERVGAGRSTILKYLTELVDEGVVERQRRRSRSNVYRVNRARLEEISKSTSRTVHQPDSPGDGQSTSRTEGVHETDLGKSTSRTFLKGTIKEPSKNHHHHRNLNRDDGGYTPDFEAWWALYPRKVDKRLAFRRWRTALKLPGVTVDTLTAAVRRYATEVAGRDPEHIKHAATWLHNRCWENAAADLTPRGDVDEWLRGEWQAGRVKSIEDATGLRYPQPDLPNGIAMGDIETWQRDQCRAWIAANHDLISARLAERRSAG